MPELVDSVAKRAESRLGTWANDKWHLERLIGVGGVAAVYAARHRNGRRVAVKVLHPELGVDASIRRRFLREGYVANRVEHPGVVVVLDDAIDGDSVMLVMELLEGETLEARCRRNDGKLEPLEVLRIASGLLSILESAHAHDILHRDITPSNIFVTKKGEIKLLDFGIARLRDSENVDHTMSVPGALGTPAFMPPEQARGLWEELDARSDLWAVGAIAFRAIAGRSVHQGRSPSELLLSAMTRRAPTLDTIVPDIPPAIAALVDRALKKQPSERWQDAKSFREAVEETYRELRGSPMESVGPLSVPEVEITIPGPGTDASHADGFGTTVGVTSFRRRRVLVVVAAVGAAALGTLIFWPLSTGSAPAVDDTARARPSITTPVSPAPARSEPAPRTAPPASVGIDAGAVDAGRTRTRKPRVVSDPLSEQY